MSFPLRCEPVIFFGSTLSFLLGREPGFLVGSTVRLLFGPAPGFLLRRKTGFLFSTVARPLLRLEALVFFGLWIERRRNLARAVVLMLDCPRRIVDFSRPPQPAHDDHGNRERESKTEPTDD